MRRVAAVIACVLLFVGACDPWAAGLLASGGVLALLTTALGIASFVLMRGPEPADKPAAGGEQKQANAIPVVQPQAAPADHKQNLTLLETTGNTMEDPTHQTTMRRLRLCRYAWRFRRRQRSLPLRRTEVMLELQIMGVVLPDALFVVLLVKDSSLFPSVLNRSRPRMGVKSSPCNAKLCVCARDH